MQTVLTSINAVFLILKLAPHHWKTFTRPIPLIISSVDAKRLSYNGDGSLCSLLQVITDIRSSRLLAVSSHCSLPIFAQEFSKLYTIFKQLKILIFKIPSLVYTMMCFQKSTICCKISHAKHNSATILKPHFQIGNIVLY